MTGRPARGATPDHRRREFLLLIGDGSCLRRATRDLLDALGLHVLGAEDGREALQLLHTGFRPGAILLDVGLATLDDPWDFRHIQLADPRLAPIPVIVLTEELSREAVHSQFREVELVRKPIRPAALLHAIRRCLQPAAPLLEQRA
jgi:CheY-like chemotaxis protein